MVKAGGWRVGFGVRIEIYGGACLVSSEMKYFHTSVWPSGGGWLIGDDEAVVRGSGRWQQIGSDEGIGNRMCCGVW
jgi:hypothetical protein